MARIQTPYGAGGGRMMFLTPFQGSWWSGARFTLGIIIANFAIWLLLVIGSKISDSLLGNVAYYFAISPETTFQKLYIWTLITYAFVHFNLMHVAGNMIFVFFFGPQLERDFGSKKFLAFYLICAVGAGLISILAKTFSPYILPTIGASGAMMGILVAYGVSYPQQVVYFWGMFPIKIWTLMIAIILIQLGFAIQNGHNSCTDYFAHIGGLATAFIYMKLPARSRRNPPRPPSKGKRKNWRGEESDEERSYYLEL